MDAIIADMEGCVNGIGVSVLQHGLDVAARYDDLRSHVLEGMPLRLEWKLPDWLSRLSHAFTMLDPRQISTYHVFHDCGKPSVRIVVDGQARYPDHEIASADLWSRLGGDPDVVDLMASDMLAHRSNTRERREAFMQHSKAPILLMTALAEIHANASLFGGLESESFKIKWKRIDTLGRMLT